MSEHADTVTLDCYDDRGNKIGSVFLFEGWFGDLPPGTDYVHVVSIEQVRLEP